MAVSWLEILATLKLHPLLTQTKLNILTACQKLLQLLLLTMFAILNKQWHWYCGLCLNYNCVFNNTAHCIIYKNLPKEMLDVCQYLIGVKRVKVTPGDCVWDFIAIVVSAADQLCDSFAALFPLDRKDVKKQLDLAARPWSCIYILFFSLQFIASAWWSRWRTRPAVLVCCDYYNCKQSSAWNKVDPNLFINHQKDAK